MTIFYVLNIGPSNNEDGERIPFPSAHFPFHCKFPHIEVFVMLKAASRLTVRFLPANLIQFGLPPK